MRTSQITTTSHRTEVQRLYEIAAAAGIFIVEGDIPGNESARYYHSHRCIVLRAGMPYVESLCALGHELGHAHYGHVCRPELDARARQERQADEYAAELLITAADYRSAEKLWGPHDGAIGHHLDVTPRIVRAWREFHSRRN